MRLLGWTLVQSAWGLPKKREFGLFERRDTSMWYFQPPELWAMTSCCGSHSICGTVLWPPRQRNTMAQGGCWKEQVASTRATPGARQRTRLLHPE